MAGPVFYAGKMTGDGVTWAKLYPNITPLPNESPPVNPLEGASSADLILFVCQGSATAPTYIRLGDNASDEGDGFLAKQFGQAKVFYPLSPGSSPPELKIPTGATVLFKLGILS